MYLWICLWIKSNWNHPQFEKNVLKKIFFCRCYKVSMQSSNTQKKGTALMLIIYRKAFDNASMILKNEIACNMIKYYFFTWTFFVCALSFRLHLFLSLSFLCVTNNSGSVDWKNSADPFRLNKNGDLTCAVCVQVLELFFLILGFSPSPRLLSIAVAVVCRKKIFPLRWKKNFASSKKRINCTYILWKNFPLPFQDMNSWKWRLSILYF